MAGWCAGVGLLTIPPLPGVIPGFGGYSFTQLNPTTRQITHLLYHSHEPISIVSHSQGCLQVRNAILIAALFRGESWTHDNLAWVATGSPLLSDVEIWPWPKKSKKFKSLVEHGDYVAQIIGLQGGPGTVNAMSGASHHFITQYVKKIQVGWLQVGV
jgi:hypothetical protein